MRGRSAEGINPSVINVPVLVKKLRLFTSVVPSSGQSAACAVAGVVSTVMRLDELDDVDLWADLWKMWGGTPSRESSASASSCESGSLPVSARQMRVCE